MLLAFAGVVSLQAAVLVMLGVAVRGGNVAATVNALGVLAGALVLAGLGALPGWEEAFGPLLLLWYSVAGVLHTVGMLGVYDSTWWWDHITHTVSASMVAAIAYAWVLVAGVPSGAPLGEAGTTLALTLMVGVAWELAEVAAREVGERFDVEPVLVVYGRRDTALDLVFDVVGGVVVVVLDLQVFVPLVEQVT